MENSGSWAIKTAEIGRVAYLKVISYEKWGPKSLHGDSLWFLGQELR